MPASQVVSGRPQSIWIGRMTPGPYGRPWYSVGNAVQNLLPGLPEHAPIDQTSNGYCDASREKGVRPGGRRRSGGWHCIGSYISARCGQTLIAAV